MAQSRARSAGQPCRGVDLNRNFDFLWSSGIGTSNSSCSDVFKGPSAFSGARRATCVIFSTTIPTSDFIDVHSYSELILYPWGDDDNQTSDPSQNFQNPCTTGNAGSFGADIGYIPAFDLDWYLITGARIRDAIAACAAEHTHFSKASAYTPRQPPRMTTPTHAPSLTPKAESTQLYCGDRTRVSAGPK